MIYEEESIEQIYYIWNYFDESHLYGMRKVDN